MYLQVVRVWFPFRTLREIHLTLKEAVEIIEQSLIEGRWN
jgi:hypothetical protein